MTHHVSLAAGGLAGSPGGGGGAGEEWRRQRRGRREEGVCKVMNKWTEGRGKRTEGQRTGLEVGDRPLAQHRARLILSPQSQVNIVIPNQLGYIGFFAANFAMYMDPCQGP